MCLFKAFLVVCSLCISLSFSLYLCIFFTPFLYLSLSFSLSLFVSESLFLSISFPLFSALFLSSFNISIPPCAALYLSLSLSSFSTPFFIQNKLVTISSAQTKILYATRFPTEVNCAHPLWHKPVPLHRFRVRSLVNRLFVKALLSEKENVVKHGGNRKSKLLKEWGGGGGGQLEKPILLFSYLNNWMILSVNVCATLALTHSGGVNFNLLL